MFLGPSYMAHKLDSGAGMHSILCTYIAPDDVYCMPMNASTHPTTGDMYNNYYILLRAIQVFGTGEYRKSGKWYYTVELVLNTIIDPDTSLGRPLIHIHTHTHIYGYQIHNLKDINILIYTSVYV